MESEHVSKPDLPRAQRLFRFITGILDPRAFLHGFRILNYYNYIHVAELRRATLGHDLRISPNCSLVNARNLVVGDRVRIGANVSLWAGPGRARIVLGDDVLLAPNVMLTASNYRFDDGSPVNKQKTDEADITVGRDVWIGYGAIVLAGVTIGDRAIIGAGAVVRGAIPPNAIVAGNPGKVMGFRRADPATGDATRSDASGSDPSGSDRARSDASGSDPSGTAPPLAFADVADPRVIQAILQEFPRLGAADLGLPLRQTGIDSFDLITLRTAIEAGLGAGFADRDWGRIETLEDIARLPQQAPPQTMPQTVPARVLPALVRPAAAVTLPKGQTGTTGQSHRAYALNMPQMALSGLGESWLFKELGDIHWTMITGFLQSASSAIADAAGDRLYATFTRIRLEVTPNLRAFRENDPFDITSSLERYGASFFFGHHRVTAPAAEVRAQTMSTFAKYGERGENTSLIKGSPTLPDPDALPSLTEFPEFGATYRTRRSIDATESLFSCTYDILAPHDINGVGLLYFAAYPMIFDLCLERFEGKGFLMAHSTVSKDICYYANSEPTETLVFRLHTRDDRDGGLCHVASLSRQSDGKRMAELVSVKQKVGG